LSTSLVIDVSRRNGLSWDCIVSCEMIGTYKTQPQAYRTCAQWLGYRPDELLMIACHNFDLMAARAEATAAPSCTVRPSGVLSARQIQCPIRRTTSSRRISPTWPHSSVLDGYSLHQELAAYSR
jgi:hypothetical protein